MAPLAVQSAEPVRPQWEYYAVATLTLIIAALAVIAPRTSSQPRSGALPVESATPSIAFLAAPSGEFTLARAHGYEVFYFYQHITSDILRHYPEASRVPPVPL